MHEEALNLLSRLSLGCVTEFRQSVLPLIRLLLDLFIEIIDFLLQLFPSLLRRKVAKVFWCGTLQTQTQMRSQEALRCFWAGGGRPSLQTCAGSPPHQLRYEN